MPFTQHPQGSWARLLPSSPLRTTRASFPAGRSSLANAPVRTRLHDGQSLVWTWGGVVPAGCASYARPDGLRSMAPTAGHTIGFALNLRGPTHRYTGGTEQAHVLRRPMRMRDVTQEHPVVAVFGSAVRVPHPVAGLAWVSTPRPLPQQGKDRMGYSRQGPLARPMLMLLCPTPHLWIKLQEQVPSDGLLVTLPDPSDGV